MTGRKVKSKTRGGKRRKMRKEIKIYKNCRTKKQTNKQTWGTQTGLQAWLIKLTTQSGEQRGKGNAGNFQEKNKGRKQIGSIKTRDYKIKEEVTEQKPFTPQHIRSRKAISFWIITSAATKTTACVASTNNSFDGSFSNSGLPSRLI